MLEVEAATLEAAIERACEFMGVAREAVGYEILEEGSKGLIGIGARPLKVRVHTTTERAENRGRTT